MRLSVLSCSCWLLVGCSNQPSPSPSQPEPEEPEPIDLDVHLEPFEVELDGDDRPETVSWTCVENELDLRVGEATHRTALEFADLIGCAVHVVDLDPDQPGKQLWVNADEHDEAGPDRNFLLHVAGGEIEVIWAENLALDLYADGSWRTEDTTCDEAQRVHRTTTTVWRWQAGKVGQSAEVHTEPIPTDEHCHDESEP